VIRASLLALGIASVLATARPAHAQREVDFVYTHAKKNDSVSMIASEFYGDRAKFPFIVAENRWKKPKQLGFGQRLRVPVIREITTEPGDTFQSLAKRYLKDQARAGVLAQVNHMAPDDSLAAGTPILIPFAVAYTPDSKESLAQIAARFYNTPKLADALRDYNGLGANVVEKGETIALPSFGVRMHPSRLNKPSAEDQQRRDRNRENNERAAKAIPAAQHAWRIGDYKAVQKELAELDLDYLDVDAAIRVGLLLGSAQIAFDDHDAALATFRQVIRRKPGLVLRKLDHSPKVLKVWTEADGKVE